MAVCSCVILLLLVCSQVRTQNYGNATALYKSLLQDYSRQLPPRRNLSTPVMVQMTLYKLYVEKVDVVQEVLVTNLILTFQWEDQHIHWNKTEYGELCQFRFPRSEVWSPDIVIQNSLDHVPYLGSSESQVSISHEEVAQITIELTSCAMLVYAFPFDSHNCFIMFGSDHYQQQELRITGIALKPIPNVPENRQWRIGNLGKRYEYSYSTLQKTDLYSVTLIVNRQPLFYILNLLLPILIIAIIKAFVILVKVDTGEKLSICVTLFLSFTVFASILSGMLPQTSSTSHVALYVSVELLLNGIYAVCSILIQQVSHMPTHNWFTVRLAQGCIGRKTKWMKKSRRRMLTASPPVMMVICVA